MNLYNSTYPYQARYQETWYDILVQSYLSGRLVPILIIIIILTTIIVFWISIYRKKCLIDAFAQQVADEISRTDINSTIDKTERNYRTSYNFTIDSMIKLWESKKGLLFDNTTSNEAEIFAKTADRVNEFNEKKFNNFLSERTTLRWAIDGLEALIGDHRSIEVAWAKGNRYLTRFLDEDKRSHPWFSTYMKILNLPYNLNKDNFTEIAKKSMERRNPKGYIILFLASRSFNYRKRLRIFNLKGEEAWKEILNFKARGGPKDFEKMQR